MEAVNSKGRNALSFAAAPSTSRPLATGAPWSQLMGRDVLDYEIWRLRAGACLDFKSLLFQAPFKSGLLISAKVADETETLSALIAAAKERSVRQGLADSEIEVSVENAFRQGLNECTLDVYHVSRKDWADGRAISSG